MIVALGAEVGIFMIITRVSLRIVQPNCIAA